MPSMSQMVTLATIFVLSGAAPAAANSSAYSDLDLDKCETLSLEGDSVTMKCAGLNAQYPTYFAEGDLRQSMLYGPADKDMIEDSFQSFGTFNHVGLKIEWRLDAKGEPFAAIHRWFIENADEKGEITPQSTGQVLVISHIAKPGNGVSCTVGYVDALANPDANELARKAADEDAADFACGYAEAQWYGERGDKSGEPMSHLPDRLKVE